VSGYEPLRAGRPATRFWTPGLVAGLGFRKGVPAAQLRTALDVAFDRAGLDLCRLASIATLDRKVTDPAIRDLAGDLGVELRGLPASWLAVQPVPTPSATVSRRIGLASVAEAAVLGASGELLQPKLVVGSVTVAVGRVP
jgi:cobalamin biosynthesis protein CbiG